MPNNSDRFFVLTGGPGAGKTTLIEALRSAGFTAMPEAGRAIIRDQLQIGGQATHQNNPALFAELMLSFDMQSYRHAVDETGPVFFDRGITELVGYHGMMGMPVPAHFRTAAEKFRYNAKVFAAPPWPEIFANDSERKQSLGEAVRTHDAAVRTYAEFGYEIVALPETSVEERLRFILAETGLAAPFCGRKPL
ncbi:AAA family ATPase [Mesorhizobium sp. BAC0120]|uniref:AAA family ATPase n=1 Tax=Mesorhizobium sp. BAC0120 TaxID=3090670 RepID=UPI00298CEE75|nr:AAA family ATPase [Mesorhizobium sp. BAC0120]MDW6020707.1 AAA family ATPase [Mesorhizobium sp. BAC0120]